MSIVTAVPRASIHAVVRDRGKINGTVMARHTIRAQVTPSDFVIGDLPYYTGEYIVTPSLDAQILPTRNMAMSDDVVIEPIPNNYGRIAWNGTTLIVY